MKTETNNKLKRGILVKVILTFLIIYCLLSVIRSLNLIYLAYSDDYFYNFDFKKEMYIQKSKVFINSYYFTPYILGSLISIVFKRKFQLSWVIFLLTKIICMLVFILVDSKFIRPLFVFFENPRENIFVHLLVFTLLGTIILYIFKKRYPR